MAGYGEGWQALGIRAAQMRCWLSRPLKAGETMAIEGDAATVPASAGSVLMG